jgi:hypothetical protein
MRGEKDCRPAFCFQAVNRFREGFDHERIETGRGFVEDEHRRAAHQRLDDSKLPFHSVRKVIEPAPEVDVADIEAQQELPKKGRVDRPGLQRAEEAEVAVASQFSIERHFGRQVADAFAHPEAGGAAIEAIHERPAAGCPHQVEQDPDGRRLSGAIRTEEAVDFPARDRQVQRLQRNDRPVVLSKRLRANRVGHDQRLSRAADLAFPFCDDSPF